MNQDSVLSESQFDAIVIGGGSSGLAVAYHLKKKGMKSLILEANESAAGSWRTRHKQLHLNTHRWLSSLPGKPIPAEWGAFISRDNYVGYLESYAQWLRNSQEIDIRYGSRVTNIERNEGVWTVHFSGGEHQASNIVIASGVDCQRFTPAFSGLEKYECEQRHAADFGDVDDYRAKRVLIVGGANSGIDIANHLVNANHCKTVVISMREGAHLMPTWFFGLPTQLITPLLNMLPRIFQDKITALMSRLCFGDLSKFNIQPPRLGICTRLHTEGTAPGFDNGFVNAVKKGVIKVVPGVASFSAREVNFVDDLSMEFDVVLFATGYRSGLEEWLGHLNVVDENGRPRVHAPAVNHQHPGLWLFGMRPNLEGSLYARTKEAKQLAEVIVASSKGDTR